MKSVNILGVHGKIRVLEGVFTKNQYMGSVGLPKKGGLGKFANLREGLGKKEGSGVFEGGVIPQCTLWWCLILSKILKAKYSIKELVNFIFMLPNLFKNCFVLQSCDRFVSITIQ